MKSLRSYKPGTSMRICSAKMAWTQTRDGAAQDGRVGAQRLAEGRSARVLPKPPSLVGRVPRYDQITERSQADLPVRVGTPSCCRRRQTSPMEHRSWPTHSKIFRTTQLAGHDLIRALAVALVLADITVAVGRAADVDRAVAGGVLLAPATAFHDLACSYSAIALTAGAGSPRPPRPGRRRKTTSTPQREFIHYQNLICIFAESRSGS